MTTHADTAVPLRETARLVMGRAKFVDDLHLEGMLHGTFIRSPMAHAEIVAIDVSAALAAGAKLVLTAKDLPFIDTPFIVRYWHASIRNGLPKPLATDRVRFVGEPVAFLVARDRYEAEDLAALVKVTYHELPAIGSVAAALAPEAPQLHPEWTGNVAATFGHSQGDMPGAMERAPRRLKRTFRFGRQAPLPLETRGIVADFDTDRSRLTAWISTQAHYNVRQNLATFLGLPEYDVRVIAEDVGGGFGGKSRTFAEELIVSHASRVLRRPVKWIEDRFEHLQATTHSRAMETDIEMGYDGEGRMLALRYRITLDLGAYVFTSGIVTSEVASGHGPGPYRFPNLSFEVRCIGTNKTPIATYRGAGQPESAFPLECMLDLVAKDVGLSAAEVRRRNLVRPSDLPYDAGTPKAWARLGFDSGDFPAALEQTLRNSGYSEEVETLPSGELAAWGLACNMESSGFVNHESAHILIDAGGHVTVRSGMTTQGQGQITTYAQVCAEGLGAAFADVTVRMGDTDLLPFGRGAFATRGAVVGANAVAGCAARLREKVLGLAATLLQCPASALSIVESRIHKHGAPTDLKLGDVARAVAPGMPLFSGETALQQEFVYDTGGRMQLGFGAQVARVALDTRTGRYRILDYYAMHDAGRILNPAVMEGQMIGGAVDGIGGAMLSEIVYDANGQLLTGSLADYLVITAPEAPRVRIDHFTTMPKGNPLGVRGVGEGGVIASAPAIVNALARIVSPADLAGADLLFSIPVKPETVLRSCRAGRG